MSKYRNIKTTIDNITFDSKAEARRYQDLKLLFRGNEISDLELQPKFNLTAHGKAICRYVADFRYKENGNTVVEDVKGIQTPVFKLKRKLFKAQYGFDILITK